jgi:cobalt-zinc-cadmium efflux system outer membrane protein
MSSRGYVAWALVALSGAASSAHAQIPGITLADALGRASRLNPDLRIAEAEVSAARAVARAARAWVYNPELSAGLGRVNNNSDSSRSSRDLGLSQRFEVGGKRGARIDAADLRASAAEARLRQTQTEVSGRVKRAFLLAQIARMRVTTSVEAEQVALQLRDAAQERLRLGAGTQLEVNVAVAAASRERWVRLRAERDYGSAVVRLSAETGLPASERPEPLGELVLLASEPRTETELVALALSRRADLRAAELERDASAASLRFARRLAVPDPAFGASTGRDDNRYLTVGVSVALPLFNRGQTERADAAGLFERARIGEEAGRQQVVREVQDAFQAYTRALDAQAGFDRDAVEKMTENLQLAEESFRAGKIGLLVFSAVRRDLVEARLAYLDALTELVEQRIALGVAIGEVPPLANERQ